MRRILTIAASALAAATNTGCTATLEAQLAQLQTQLRDVTRQVGQSQVRHESMQNRVLVLEEELRRKHVSRLQTAPRIATALTPQTDPGPPAAAATRPEPNAFPSQPREPVATPACAEPAPEATRAAAPRRESVVDEIPGDLPMVRLAPGATPSPAVSAQRLADVKPADAAPSPDPSPAAPTKTTTPFDAQTAGKAIPKLTAKVLYRRGLAAFRRGHNERALAHFAAFAARFPEHSLADNALYWSGRAQWKRGDHDAAIAAYRHCIARYPTGNKVPDAWLALSEVLSATGRASQARDKLAHLTKNYPASSAARIASRRLSENKP